MEVSWKAMLAGGIIIVLLIGVCYTQREIISLKKQVDKNPVKDSFEAHGEKLQLNKDKKKESKWAD